nr:NADH dehydrogenase subunit 5 [Pyemotes zhonghuajia]
MFLFYMVMYIIFFFFFFLFFFDSFILSYNLFSLMQIDLNLIFWFDKISLMFGLIVCLISMSILLFSNFYMGNLMDKKFYFLMFLFIMSMLILIFSGNLIMMILGWDGLGIVSFILVIYYKNKISLQSGILTILMNRFGDVAMIAFISLTMYNSMNMINMMLDSLMIMLLMLGCITKSAQYPFSIWLPAAMTAPTPISSLVHSSTLVTAGIYLMIRFFDYLYFMNLLNILNLLGLLTMLVGGFMAIMELDMKKIVAFSTLSQLGMMIFILSVGEVEISFLHLLVHAIFKSMLFMVCGSYMYMNFGVQDGRNFNVNLKSNYILMLFLSISCLNLMGFIFLMGFYSKDLILESLMFDSMGLMKLLFFLVGCILTGLYTLKMYMEGMKMLNSGYLIEMSMNYKNYIFMFLILFVIISFMGLVMEEMLIMDLLFSLNQDLKFIDLMIILISVFLWILNQKYSMITNYLMMEFFYLSFLLKFFSMIYMKLSIYLNKTLDLWVELIESDLFWSILIFKKY